MTLGNASWGSPDDVSEAIFKAYVDAGGNFLDIADVYSKGRSEELLGRFIATRKLRDDIVLASKYSFSGGTGPKIYADASRLPMATLSGKERFGTVIGNEPQLPEPIHKEADPRARRPDEVSPASVRVR